MTTPDQSKGGRARDEVLAGEYVLGVLAEADRLEVEKRLRSDRDFVIMVKRWKDNLSSFGEEELVELPRVAVKRDAVKPVKFRRAKALGKAVRQTSHHAWSSISFWRGLSFVVVLLLLCLSIVELGMWERRNAREPLVADLQTNVANLALVAHYDRLSGEFDLSAQKVNSIDKSVLFVWLTNADGTSRPLGPMPSDGLSRLTIAEDMRAELHTGATIALSEEPKDAKPGAKPLGPVIATGTLRLN